MVEALDESIHDYPAVSAPIVTATVAEKILTLLHFVSSSTKTTKINY